MSIKLNDDKINYSLLTNHVFFFSNPLPKTHEGFEKKKLQERIPVVFHLHNLLDSVEIYRKRTLYYLQPDHYLLVPSLTQLSLSGVNNLRDIIAYDRYDNRGNILQYSFMGNFSISYLWSYNGQYPVAEIRNATYNQAINSLTPNLLLNLITYPNYPTDEMINAMSNNLRSNLPQAEVTTYTYKPLVGMTSKTDPRGVTTYYEYDDFGRLKATYIGEKDANGNEVRKLVTGSFDYHYRE